MAVVTTRARRGVGDARRDSGHDDDRDEERQPPESATSLTLLRFFEEKLYRIKKVRVMLVLGGFGWCSRIGGRRH